MKVVCIGANPAALYLGILLKRQDLSHSVRFFPEAARTTPLPSSIVCNPLKRRLKLADAEVIAAANAEVTTFDRVEVDIGDRRFETHGLAYASVRTAGLITSLKRIAAELGCEFLQREAVLEELENADVVVAADGPTGAWRPAGKNATQVEISSCLHVVFEIAEVERRLALPLSRHTARHLPRFRLAPRRRLDCRRRGAGESNIGQRRPECGRNHDPRFLPRIVCRGARKRKGCR